MKKLKFVILILLYPMSLLAQEEINQFNSKGERHGVWKKYYDNGNIRYTGTFQNGKEVGEFRFYSENNSKFPTIVRQFDSDGLSKVFFYSENGVPESKGSMNGKLRVGKWIYFDKNGKTVLSEENYKDGVLDGELITFYPDGKPTEVYPYKNGKIDGMMRRFSNEGIVLDEVMYKDGLRNGPAKYYNTNGQLLYSGMYQNDIKVGNWVYTENGNRDQFLKQ